MNRSRRFSVLVALSCLLVLFTSPAVRALELVFGPEIYHRTTEDPLVELVDFDVAEGVQDCVLQVYNGGFGSETKSDYVSTAWVGLNGQFVFDPDDFNKTVVFLETGVNVGLSNQLSVEMAGSPDSRLEIWLQCENTVRPTPGVLLEGDPDSPAAEAFFDLAPQAAPSDEIVDGVILSRLDVWFDPDATVGQVNHALASVGGRIVSMLERLTSAAVAVPPQANVADLQALAAQFEAHPAVLFSFTGRTPVAKALPPGMDFDDMQFLLPTRFPAAWNVRALAQRSCAGIQVIVVDHFDANQEPEGFTEQLPGFTLIDPDQGALATDIHGYQVAGALAALFDSAVPAGANPLPGCLAITGLNVDGLTWTQTLGRITGQLPSGRFVLNMSLGFRDKVECGLQEPQFVCPDETEYTKQLHFPIYRAMLGLDWKLLTQHRWQDFVAITSAGNEANKHATGIYAGLGQADYDNLIAVAATTDPLFGFVQDDNLWSSDALLGLPSLVATPAQVAFLRFLTELYGLQNTVAENVLTVGSVTGGNDFDPTIPDLTESDFSDRNPDVKAIGESITVIGGEANTTVSGTSFSSPQVAGLAAYLMMLDPTITPAQVRQAILANAKNNANTTDIVDAYATVLSLDAAALPTQVNAPLRNTVLDVNDDGFFTLADISEYLARYTDPNTLEPIPDPDTRDWSRYDLNGDGLTGGSGVTSFDLNRIGSAQYGMGLITSDVTQEIGGVGITFNEFAVSDLDILCYYANSDLFFGPQADQDVRDELLNGLCPTNITISPTSITLAPGGTVLFSAEVLGPDNTDVTWSAQGGGSIDSSGLYTAGDTPGEFTVTATSVADPSAIAVAVVTVEYVSYSGTYVGTGIDYDYGDCYSCTASPVGIVVTQEGDQLTILFTEGPALSNDTYTAVLTGTTFSGSTNDCFHGPCGITGSFSVGGAMSGTAVWDADCPGGCYVDFTATKQE